MHFLYPQDKSTRHQGESPLFISRAEETHGGQELGLPGARAVRTGVHLSLGGGIKASTARGRCNQETNGLSSVARIHSATEAANQLLAAFVEILEEPFFPLSVALEQGE